MRLGQLSLASEDAHGAGQAGRLVLDDGTVLEADWCTDLGNGEIGISLFGRDQNREGWLEGAIDPDRHVIRFASLEIWGAVCEELTEEGPEAVLPPHMALDWLGSLWSERVKGFVAASQSWFASAQPTAAPGLN